MNECDGRGRSGDESRVRPEEAPGLFAWAYIASRRRLLLSFSFRSSERETEKSPIHQTLTLTQQERRDPAMAVEQVQFAMPVAAGSEGFPLIPSVQEEKRKAKEAFSMVRKPEAAIVKAKAKAKAKSKAHKEEVVRKARAKAEAEAAVRRAKAEAAKEAGVVKPCCCGSDDDDGRTTRCTTTRTRRKTTRRSWPGLWRGGTSS
ncbi:hypothetical protein ACQJBY_024946 [Aegilops geniculata]